MTEKVQSNKAFIKLENVSFSYGKTHVLNNFSLSLEQKQITCLLGASGSGKTTILRLIAGLEIPQTGSVFIDGRLAAQNGKLIIPPQHRDVGFIFQDLALWPHLTVYQNVEYALKFRRIKNYAHLVRQILDFFSILPFAGKYPHQLSGGQKQLAAIARALVLKPRILLMDEPMANLDVIIKRKIIAYIRQLPSEFDLTIVYVTHDHKEAFAFADKIAVLHNGQIEDFGTAQDIRNSTNEYVRYFIEF